MGKLKNFIEKHFVKQTRPPNQKSDSYRCKYCTKSYVFHTTRMYEHLLQECKSCPAEVKRKLNEITDYNPKTSKTKKRKMMTDTRKNTNSSSDSDFEETSQKNNQARSSSSNKRNPSGKGKNFFDNVSVPEQEELEIIFAKSFYTGGKNFLFAVTRYLHNFLIYNVFRCCF